MTLKSLIQILFTTSALLDQLYEIIHSLRLTRGAELYLWCSSEKRILSLSPPYSTLGRNESIIPPRWELQLPLAQPQHPEVSEPKLWA